MQQDTVTGKEGCLVNDKYVSNTVIQVVVVYSSGARGIVTFNFSPRNLTQVTSTMKPGQDSMFGFSSVKRITLREGLY